MASGGPQVRRKGVFGSDDPLATIDSPAEFWTKRLITANEARLLQSVSKLLTVGCKWTAILYLSKIVFGDVAADVSR
jgi:hypothetical protein